MTPVLQTFSVDLDGGGISPLPISLPLGYTHIIRLNLIKGGVSGYELIAGGSITMLFDDAFPVDDATPVHSLLPVSWAWNAVDQVYEAGFDATQRPISIIGLTTLATKLTIQDTGNSFEKSFHVGFRSTPLPGGIDTCARQATVPQEVQNYVRALFRYTLLPDQPEIVDQFFANFQSLTTAQTASAIAIFGDIGITTEAITTGATSISITPPAGFVSADICSVMIKRISGADQVAITSQSDASGSSVVVEITASPVDDGTHELVALFRK